MEHCENARWQAETRVPEVFFGCYFDCVCGVFLYHVNDLYVINATAYVSQLILSVVFFNPNYGNVEIFLFRWNLYVIYCAGHNLNQPCML